MGPITQACSSCGTQVYEFGFCSHCGAPLCSACIKKHELVMGLGAGHESKTIPIQGLSWGGGMLWNSLGYHKIDTLNFPFPHCPACVGAHARTARVVNSISMAVGLFFFALIFYGMLAGSGFMWNNTALYAVLALILGSILGIITYVLTRGLRYRQEVIRCPQCGENIQANFVQQGLSGRTVVPYGSETMSFESKTYIAGLNVESESHQIADHVHCPVCNYDGPLKERMGLHKFVTKNGIAPLKDTMWESFVKK